MLLIKKCYTNGGGKWREVGDGALFTEGIVIPNHKPLIPNPDIHDMGAYDTPDIMVCQALNTAPKMCRNVTKL